MYIVDRCMLTASLSGQMDSTDTQASAWEDFCYFLLFLFVFCEVNSNKLPHKETFRRMAILFDMCYY